MLFSICCVSKILKDPLSWSTLSIRCRRSCKSLYLTVQCRIRTQALKIDFCIPLAVELPFAVPRPQTSAEMFERQGSFRVFPTLNETVSPFKRQMSLRVNDLPSNVQRRQRLIFIHRKHNVGILLSTTRCVKVTRQYYSLC